MADIDLEPLDFSFGIQDTLKTEGQKTVDDFLGGKTVTASPEDVKDINEPEPPKAEVKKKVVEKKEEVKPEEKTFDPLEEVEIPEDEKETEDEEFNTFESFSQELYNLGAFDKGDEDVISLPKTGEEFLSLFNEQSGRKAETIIDNYLNRFGEEHRQAFDAIFVNGVNPKDYYQTYNELQDFSQLDLSIERNQESVLRQAFTDLGYEPEDVEAEIAGIKERGDLETQAGRHSKVVIKRQQQKLNELVEQKKQVAAYQEGIKNQFKTNVINVLNDKLKTKEFDGIPLNPQLATEVNKMLTSYDWKTSSGEPLTEFDKEILDLKKPENHPLKVKVALLLKMLKQDPTLSTLKKAAVTKESNEAFNFVVKQKPKQTAQKSTTNSWANL